MKARLAIPLALLAAAVLPALFATTLPLAPDRIDLTHVLSPPAADAWLGHDDLGRSIADRLVFGLRTSLAVAVLVIPLAAVTGTIVGMAAGWLGGAWDAVGARVIDIFMAFPGTLLAIALSGLLGPGIGNVVVALAAVGWVGYARLARAQTLALRGREHIAAARLLGVPVPLILWRHVLPLIAAPLIVHATLGVAAVIMAEAGLSFLGLGVQPPAASLGAMIRDGAAYMLVAPHAVIVPGAALFIVVLAVNLLGEQLNDRLGARPTVR
jgi:peptide/nickel transport system permease protein